MARPARHNKAECETRLALCLYNSYLDCTQMLSILSNNINLNSRGTSPCSTTKTWLVFTWIASYNLLTISGAALFSDYHNIFVYDSTSLSGSSRQTR